MAAEKSSMPKRDEHRNNEPRPECARPRSPASIVQPPLNAEEEEAASAARVAKWLTLADTVLVNERSRQKGEAS